MKPLEAPTIFMMAISSRRVKVASLMVFVMMKKDTTISITISIREMTLTMFLAVMKPSAYSRCAFTLATPSTA